jgi:hypothetical protein
MRLILFFSIVLTLLGSGQSYSQTKSLVADKPMTDSFPLISGKIWSRNPDPGFLNKNTLTISEDSKNVDFSISPESAEPTSGKNKRVILLVENHYLYRGQSIRNFYTDVFERGIGSAVHPGDQVMLCSFDWHRGDQYLFSETPFTDDPQVILAAMESMKSKSALGNQQEGSDINHALVQAIELLSQQKDSMPSAVFLFSDDLDNIVDVLKPLDVQIASRKSNIPIYSIAYSGFSRYNAITRDEICLPTYGLYYINSSNNADSCAVYFSNFMNAVIARSQGCYYRYSYRSSLEKNGQVITFNYQIAEDRDSQTITLPTLSFTEWIMAHKMISGVCVMLFIGIIVIVILWSNKTKRDKLRQAEELKRTQEELRIQQEKTEQEKRQTEQKFQQLNEDQQRKEAEIRNQEAEKIKQAETERLTRLMLNKGAFPRLNYSFEGNSGSIDVTSPHFTIGRDKSNSFYIQLDTVSRKHATIQFNQDGSYNITDNGSSNGTYVNGTRINQSPLRSGDFIEIGGIGITFQN